MRRLVIVVSLIVAALHTGQAQTTEAPAAFDTAGRILSVNPTLVTRLGLTQPGWPVTGSFTEARLFQSSTGGFVLVVQRNSSLNERFVLTNDEATALRAEFSRGMDRVGRMVAEDPASIIAEPARRPFVRDQMLLAAFVYGPSLASLSDDPSLGSSLYLMSIGGTFFGLTNFARNRPITKAQNSLATDGAIRGWIFAASLENTLGIQPNQTGASLTALVGGIGGSIVGFNRGANLTNSEAQAATTGSTLLAGATLGLAATTGVLGDSSSSRMVTATLIAGGLAGYIVGPRYPRRASYTVTAGDISLVRMGAVLGSLVAITPIVDNDNIDTRVAAGLATAGWIGGAVITDRIAARPFNHSEGDARMIGLGALGGSLMGLSLPVMVKSDNDTFIMATMTGGAIVGALATQSMMSVSRQGSRPSIQDGDHGGRLEIDPQGLVTTVLRQPGQHSLIRIRF